MWGGTVTLFYRGRGRLSKEKGQTFLKAPLLLGSRTRFQPRAPDFRGQDLSPSCFEMSSRLHYESRAPFLEIPRSVLCPVQRSLCASPPRNEGTAELRSLSTCADSSVRAFLHQVPSKYPRRPSTDFATPSHTFHCGTDPPCPLSPRNENVCPGQLAGSLIQSNEMTCLSVCGF